MAAFFRNSSQKKRLSSFQIIIYGFAAMILTGTCLLMLPAATAGAGRAGFLEALFTATSAGCVTGLVLHDTATYWSAFGQAVILALIQIGGMGVVTVAVSIAMVSGKKIGLMQRSTMQEAVSAHQVGGIVRLTGLIIKVTFASELIGAVVMAPVFCRDFGLGRGLWMALFHSISAFCNAGFDLLGARGQFSSLTSYWDNPVINLTIVALLVVGGIGFITWNDIRTNGIHIRRYRMQSKAVLAMAGVLLVFPAVFFFVFEFRGMQPGERLLLSVFQSATARTAGFNTADLAQLSEVGRSLLIVLMLIGGSPGSTAGGMKTTTVAVLLAATAAVFRRRESAQMFSRRVDDDAVKNAAAIGLLYLVLFLLGGAAISMIEGLPMLTCLFETASAIGTVGLTLGVTPTLCTASRVILITLMFLGRVGGLTFVFAAVSDVRRGAGMLPMEKITIG